MCLVHHCQRFFDAAACPNRLLRVSIERHRFFDFCRRRRCLRLFDELIHGGARRLLFHLAT